MEVIIAVTLKGGYNGGALSVNLSELDAKRGTISQIKEGKYVQGLFREFRAELIAGQKFCIGLRDRTVDVWCQSPSSTGLPARLRSNRES